MQLSDAVSGFLLDCAARRLAPGTVSDYTNSLKKLQSFCGAVDLADITANTLRRFLASLTCSKKQCLNIHTGLSAFYTYLVHTGMVPIHLMHQIARPRPEQRIIAPLTKDDIIRLLGSVAGRFALRDRAILLLLLDTGIRASELCSLRVGDYTTEPGQVLVLGKGSKERLLPVSMTTRGALESYAAGRDGEPSAQLFLGRSGGALTRSGLLQIVWRLGARAGVLDCHPHRFRHTFAICYLRNGGDVYSLQMSLGHESLEMCRRYLALAAADLAAVHRRASPVSGWAL